MLLAQEVWLKMEVPGLENLKIVQGFGFCRYKVGLQFVRAAAESLFWRRIVSGQPVAVGSCTWGPPGILLMISILHYRKDPIN